MTCKNQVSRIWKDRGEKEEGIILVRKSGRGENKEGKN